MTKLWAVQGDKNTHGNGSLIATNPQTVFVNSIPVIEVEDDSNPDDDCFPVGPPHCNPYTTTGAPSTFVYGNPVHRHEDERVCGATTVVELQTNVFVGDLSVANGTARLVEGVLVPTNPYSPAGSRAIAREGAGAPEDDEGLSDTAPTVTSTRPVGGRFTGGGGSNPTFGSYSSPTDNSTAPGAPTTPATTDDKTRSTEPPERKEVETGDVPTGVDYNYKLSANFIVKDFTIGALYKHELVAQKGYTVQQLITNLKYLAENIAEPVRDKYPGFRINSGFRQGSAGSQHCNGMAMDIQWPGLASRDYMPRAQWIKDNLDYDQIIFEHGNTIWLHLSYDKNKSRQRNAVLTMYKGGYEPGLKLYYA